MKKKSIVMLATGIILTASLVIGGTLAYFTDNKTATNSFTVGAGVTIDVTESAIKPDGNGNYVADTSADRVIKNEYKDIMPGSDLYKDPTIFNTGSTPIYARMKVMITKADAWQAACANHNITDLGTIFVGFDGAKWERDGDPAHDAGANTLTYTYNYVAGQVAVGKDTGALFTNVIIPGALTPNEMKAIDGFQLLITGEAIQANGFDTADAAFAAIDQALADNAPNT